VETAARTTAVQSHVDLQSKEGKAMAYGLGSRFGVCFGVFTRGMERRCELTVVFSEQSAD
jgi:hypothetical protein